MKCKALPAITVMVLLSPLVALAGQPVEVEIYDRTDGRILPVYWHGGERHVAGEPGHEYEIRMRSRSGGRMLAVTSVDGVNVLSGQTAAHDQGGYVMDPYGWLAVDGWRKNLEEVAAFYFTALPDSYAARTGRPDNVGVIGIALFRERVDYEIARPGYLVPQPATEPSDPASERTASADEAAAAPPATRTERDSGAGIAGQLQKESRLGTGHGQRLDSSAVYTQFERANESPDVVIRIFYDSYRNLVAQGVIPKPRHRMVRRVPDPFPGGFVPDP